MIPQIKCLIHKDEDIVLLDINKQPTGKYRSYCLECLVDVQFKKIIQMKKIEDQTNQYCNKMTKEIMEHYNLWINMIKKTIESLTTMKKKLISCFDEMIQKSEQQLLLLTNSMYQEQEPYKNITKDLTRTKLEFIGEVLSGNHIWESKINNDEFITLGGEIVDSINQLIITEQQEMEAIRNILMEQRILQCQIKQEQHCFALEFNQEQNMIVGGRGKDIVIWQQDQFQLKEISILKGHSHNVTAIVIYQSGDMIVSSGDKEDKQIKLWRKSDNQWNNIQTINDHKDRITYLQLTKNQEQLVSASVDKLIKVWKMKQPNYQLECIQTIDDNNYYVYWVSICQDSMFMASSSWQTYFNIYKNEQTQINPWKKINKIETKGQIRRIYFTNTNELLVQQENPPLLIVYSKNINNQYQAIQDIILNQPDNNEILFPMFQINNSIYLKNDTFVYIIRRLRTGKYFIQQILTQLYRSGCRDCSGQGIILYNINNKSIEIYK